MGLSVLSCNQTPAFQDVTAKDWNRIVQMQTAPTAIYVWASWSRPSVELLPSILELEQEYEPLGVRFLHVSLDVDSSAEAVALMEQLDGPPFYRLTGGLEEASGLLGIHEPPAVIGFRDGQTEPLRLEPGVEGALVSPDEAVALLEQLVAQDPQID